MHICRVSRINDWNRIYKEHGSTKEFYLRDHTGQELAVFGVAIPRDKVSGVADSLKFIYTQHQDSASMMMSAE